LITERGTGHGEKQSRTWEKAIACLLSENTIEGAARQAGIGFTTLNRWLNDSEFQQRYREARRQIIEQTVSRLVAVASRAVQALDDIVSNPETAAAARVTAARTILENVYKWNEVSDLQARVEALEKILAERQEEQAA